MSYEKIIKIPKSLEDIKKPIEDSMGGVVVVLADKNYHEIGSNETAYQLLADQKWKKPVILGIVGLLTAGAEDERIAFTGKTALASAIAEGIHKYLINPAWVTVKKLDNGLEFKGEGFDANDTVHIVIDGQEIGKATADANGSFDITVTGTVTVKSATLIAYSKSRHVEMKIPYSITPSTSTSSSSA